MDEVAATWREALLETVRPHLGTPLLLSGGMDSKTLLAAQVELGVVPHCYTLRIGKRDSQDLRFAHEAARSVGAELTEVVMEHSLESLVRDIRDVILIIQRSGKAAIQCAHPVLIMARRIGSDGHTRAMTGVGGICEDNRKCQVAARAAAETGDWSPVDALRLEGADDSSNPATASWAMHRAGASVGLEVSEPYENEPVRSVGLAIPYSEINNPKQKGIALRAFPEFYSKVSWKQNAALQIGTNLRDYHDILLSSKYNTRGLVRVIGIYNDLAKEIL